MSLRRFSIAASCLILLFAIRAVQAQSPASTSAVTEYVKAEMKRQHIPGLSLLVVKDGKVIRSEGFGFANVELQVPVKPETIFQSGSVGKQFTATAVMMLVEERKIGLDDPLTKYFTDAPPAWKDVTVRELLSHTAGFGDYPKNFDFRKDWTEAEELKLIESIPLAYRPGTNWAYSNFGYVTLGILIHRVTGEFYGDFLQQRIFQPLGMGSTRIISEADIVPNRAAGYRLVKGELKNQEWVSPDREHYRRRQPVFHHSRSRQMGCRTLHRETSEAVQPRSHVDASEAEEWQAKQRRLRFWLVHRAKGRPPMHSSRRRLARI